MYVRLTARKSCEVDLSVRVDVLWHSISLLTSCSRFPNKVPEIYQKDAQTLLQNSQKLLFVTKVSQKLLIKGKTFFVSLFICCDAKISKSNIVNHFFANLRFNQRRQINLFTIRMSKYCSSKSILIL